MESTRIVTKSVTRILSLVLFILGFESTSNIRHPSSVNICFI